VTVGYLAWNREELLDGVGVGVLARVPENGVGLFMVAARMVRQAMFAVVVVVVGDQLLYALGIMFVAEGVFFGVMCFYRPYKIIYQDYANILG
jgi:hypothetical protein